MFGTMPSVRAPRWARWLALTTLAAAGLVAITSCERRRGCAGEYCGTLVFAAPGEPDILLPAVTQQQYAQDIAGQLFLSVLLLRHGRSEEHTSELQSRSDLVCRLLLEKKKKRTRQYCDIR